MDLINGHRWCIKSIFIIFVKRWLRRSSLFLLYSWRDRTEKSTRVERCLKIRMNEMKWKAEGMEKESEANVWSRTCSRNTTLSRSRFALPLTRSLEIPTVASLFPVSGRPRIDISKNNLVVILDTETREAGQCESGKLQRLGARLPGVLVISFMSNSWVLKWGSWSVSKAVIAHPTSYLGFDNQRLRRVLIHQLVKKVRNTSIRLVSNGRKDFGL